MQQTLNTLPDIKIILELISKGESLEETLMTLVEYIESNSEDMICSILLLDDQNRLRHGAALHLPVEYIKAIDGTRIGPNEGSCGAAAARNQQIIVADIAKDPLWKNYRSLALKHDLRACWSAPIRSSTGTVLGTFAIYYETPRLPTDFHLRLIEQAVYLAAIAIEHSRFEEDLHKSELKSRRLRVQLTEAIESLTEGFALYDAEDRLVMCNTKYREIYNESADLLVPGVRFEDHIRSSAFRGQVAEAVGREEEWIQERLRLHLHPQGSFRQQLGNGRWLMISEQKTADGGICGVRTEITQQVQYEEELRASIQLIDSIRNLLSNYIADSNPHKVFRDFLQTLLRSTDSSYGFIGEVIQNGDPAPRLKLLTIIKSSELEDTRQYYINDSPSDPELFNLEVLLELVMNSGDILKSNQPSEEESWHDLLYHHALEEVSSFLVLPIYSQGELIGVAGIANRPAGYNEKLVEFLKPLLVTGGTLFSAYRNAVMREKSENALRISEERFSKIFHLNPLAKLIINLKTSKLIDVNDAFLKLTQYFHDEVVNKTLRELTLHPDPTYWDEIINTVRRDGQVCELEASLRIKTGEERTVECFAFQIKTAKEPLLFLMMKDITEQRQANEQNRQLQIQLQHSEKMKAIGQLASSVAHEFNNILVGINMNAELLLETLKEDIPEPLREPLQDIQKSGERAAELVKQMLAFGHKKQPNTAWVDLNKLVTNNQSILQRIVGERIRVELKLDPQTKPAWADEAEVEQALMNLVVNARDAMSEGGYLTIATHNVDYSEGHRASDLKPLTGPYSQLSVRDTGCGMAPETVEQIFEPFFTTKPPAMGTGLGLSTVLRDISNAGGFVSVESQLGEGTEFRIDLPQTQGKSIKNRKQEASRAFSPGLGQGETVLVCDDEPMVLTAIASMVTASGYRVVKASGPDDAICVAATHSEKISLLITDFNMPGMNGRQLALRLMAQDPELKVIYLTGMADDVPESSDGEPLEIIQKPVKMGVLAQKIRTVLDNRDANRE